MIDSNDKASEFYKGENQTTISNQMGYDHTGYKMRVGILSFDGI